MDGDSYFYANALQVHAGSLAVDDRMAVGGRQQWFGCSCCPTNIMRTLASLQSYVATQTEDAVQLHLFGAASVEANFGGGALRLRVETEYPFDGRVVITAEQVPDRSVGVQIRIPSWATEATVESPAGAEPVEPGRYLRIDRRWSSGERVVLDLGLRPRLTVGSHRADSTRGCVAIERGPLVYAVEQLDQPAGVLVDDLALDGSELTDQFDPELLGGTVVVHGAARLLGPDATAGPVRFTAVPYFQWANREVGPMRVWLPVTARGSAAAAAGVVGGGTDHQLRGDVLHPVVRVPSDGRQQPLAGESTDR